MKRRFSPHGPGGRGAPAPAGIARDPRGRPAPRPPRGASAPAEAREPVLGLRAGLAVLARRPADVLRVAYARDVAAEVQPFARAASGQVPFAEVSGAELDRLAQSSHHEGLCVFARERPWASAQILGDALLRTKGTAVALDRVRNPYNVGAVLRSAAFFGVEAALLGAPAPHPGLPPTAVRVAEGGVEHLLLARTTDLADTLGRLRARGIAIVGAEGEADRTAIGFRFGAPAVLVLGNEREGLLDRVRASCDALVAIPGSGAVESLNVAVAAGVLISEMMRRT